MLTLYYKPTCPFCQKTLAAINELGVTITLRDITADESFAKELEELGGKRQVPFLVDEEHDLKIYESDDIIAHLRAHHGHGAESGDAITVHTSDDASTCPPKDDA